MKQKLYHGTSADNLASILRNGLTVSTGGQLWNCSGDALYFWSPAELVKAGECEAEYSDERARQNAIESAQFALSIAKDCRAVVVCVEIETEAIEADDSCPNMAGSGAVCVRRDVKRPQILSVDVSNDLSLFRGYFLCMALDWEYSNVAMDNIEEKIARAFQKAEIYPEDVDALIEMTPVQISTRGRRSA